MDQKLKERLLGAVIILSVSVFVIPTLFKKNNTITKLIPDLIEDDSDNKNDLEDEPKLQSRLQPKFQPKLQSKLPLRPQAQPNRAVTRLEPRVAETKTSKTTRLWVLRMGVFSHPANAKSLIESLFSKGYPAYSRIDKTTKNKELTRVFVGPYKSEKEIKKIQDRLKNELKIQGLVLFIQTPEGVV